MEAQRMLSAQVALDSGNVVRDVSRVVLRIGQCAGLAHFFIHPCNDAQRPFGMQVEFVNNLRALHRDNNTSAIVDRASAEIPRIEVPGYDYDLLGMFAALQIRYNVVLLRLGADLRRERQMDAYSTARSQARDQFCVLCADGARGDRSVNARSGVRKAVCSIAG